MRTYAAGEDRRESWDADTRGWVFSLLENPEYRRRVTALDGLELRRRPGCESCLRALVIDEWSHDEMYHLGWCDSCRRASFALGMHAASGKGAGTPHRHRALWFWLAALAVVAIPVLGSQVLMNDDGSRLPTDPGVAQVVPIPRAKPPAVVDPADRRGATARALPRTT